MAKSIIMYLQKCRFEGKMRVEMFDLILERMFSGRINWQNAGVDFRVLAIC